MTRSAEYKKAHREANPEAYRGYVRKSRDKLRQAVIDAKDVPCMDCGIKYPSYVMDFDHREDKLFDVSRGVNDYGMKKLLAEIAKCDVVCANCHRFRTHGDDMIKKAQPC